jgi:hypothetical protein
MALKAALFEKRFDFGGKQIIRAMRYRPRKKQESSRGDDWKFVHVQTNAASRPASVWHCQKKW